MSDFDTTLKAIDSLVASMRELQQRAARQYQPLVDDILLTRSRDIPLIEHTLDGLLDFCGHEPVLQMYKKLCRHYWDIDPTATADYINTYHEHWDIDAPEGSTTKRSERAKKGPTK